MSLDDLYLWGQKQYDLYSTSVSLDNNLANRFSGYNDGEQRHMKYDIGKVPGTNIDFISLFRMNDFNFSDIIKHGTMRQGPLTDKYLGTNKSNRTRDDKLFGGGQGTLKKIPVTYDNGISPDVANNFSLTSDLMQGGDHFKKQYQSKGDGYTSITQFMDKSIMYAANALREIGYTPDFIIAPPSSSQYNDFYCTNLSRKLGKPYIKDFFSRNITQVVCDEERMRQVGMSDEQINVFKNKVNSEVANEIADMCAQPMMSFAKQYQQVFGTFIKQRGSKNVATQYYDFGAIAKTLCQMSANALINNLQETNTDFLYKHICFKLASENYGMGVVTSSYVGDWDRKIEALKARNKDGRYDAQLKQMERDKKNDKIERGRQIEIAINSAVHSRELAGPYREALARMHQIILQNKERLEGEGGIKLNMASKRFKITDFDKRERPFLQNVYVVADKNLNKNGQLFNQLRNGKFLIFDEDMNSGATLKLAIDALQDKLPEQSEDSIKCLVNCYSSGGR